MLLVKTAVLGFEYITPANPGWSQGGGFEPRLNLGFKLLLSSTADSETWVEPGFWNLGFETQV